MERVGTLEALREEWSALAESTRNIFNTWEWASAWWRNFGAGSELMITAGRDPEGRLVALIPLYRNTSYGLRVMRFLGHGPGDQLGPLCRPEHKESTGRALRALVRSGACDVFFGEELPCEEAWGTRVGTRVHRRVASPLLRLEDASWDDFLRTRSRNLRAQIGRKERQLSRGHDVSYRLASDPDQLPGDLDLLFDLHRSAIGSDSRFLAAERFHREFARDAFERGWLRLWFLEADGQPVAAWYGFRFAGAEWFYQAGRDRSWDAYSPGLLVLVHSIREALQDGASVYHFGRGSAHYKDRFANADPGVETVVVAQGMWSRTAVAVARLARRNAALKSVLKNRLEL